MLKVDTASHAVGCSEPSLVSQFEFGASSCLVLICQQCLPATSADGPSTPLVTAPAALIASTGA